MPGAPKILIPITALPGALPGAAQWVSPFAVGVLGFHDIRMVSWTGIAASTLTIHIVPAGAAALPANAWQNALVVAINTQGERTYFERQFLLLPGYSIWAFAGAAAAVNLIINGTEYT